MSKTSIAARVRSPYGHEYVEPGEAADRLVAIRNGLVKTITSAASEPQSAGSYDVLAIVENRDLHAGDLIRIARVMTWPP
jgi:hypothetical protein